jgi:hypothetical protein
MIARGEARTVPLVVADTPRARRSLRSRLSWARRVPGALSGALAVTFVSCAAVVLDAWAPARVLGGGLLALVLPGLLLAWAILPGPAEIGVRLTIALGASLATTMVTALALAGFGEIPRQGMAGCWVAASAAYGLLALKRTASPPSC